MKGGWWSVRNDIQSQFRKLTSKPWYRCIGCWSSRHCSTSLKQCWGETKALDYLITNVLSRVHQDARKLVESAKFPPRGRRGFGSPFSPEKFGLKTLTEYLQQANDGLVTIVQIETKEALQNVDSIAQTPGVDVLLIGPYDLGNNIGCPILNDTMAEELKKAITTIQQSAEKHEKRTGIYCTSGSQARQFADGGFNMVCSNAASANFRLADSCPDLSRWRCSLFHLSAHHRSFYCGRLIRPFSTGISKRRSIRSIESDQFMKALLAWSSTNRVEKPWFA